MTSVNGKIGKKLFRTEIQSESGHAIIADEPESLGGKNEGMDPYELLCAALVACTCATLRMYIERKNWDIPKIEVLVSLERDDKNNVSTFNRQIKITGSQDESTLKRLLDVANKCPVHKMLTNPVQIETSIST